MEAAIPDKIFYKIGEVADITTLRPSVLRYWESEFNVLNPKKSRSGQRLYSKEDLEVIREIKQLLYTEKLTIEGAKKKIAGGLKRAGLNKNSIEIPKEMLMTILHEVIVDLKNLRNTL